MRIANYYIPTDWRRVHFSINHPTVTPVELPVSKTKLPQNLTLVLHTKDIVDIREVRNWLHDKAYTDGHYDLFGWYRIEQAKYEFRSEFRGVTVVFHHAVHVYHFRLYWNGSLPLEA